MNSRAGEILSALCFLIPSPPEEKRVQSGRGFHKESKDRSRRMELDFVQV
jgi:hypothetical protein